MHRRALLPIYLPAFLLGLPAQASLVLLPLTVLERGGSTAAAAAVVGWHGVGMMLAALPGGLVIARFGEQRLMLGASALIAAAYAAYALVETVAWFPLVAIANGAGAGAFMLGRLAYISAHVEGGERGRVIALVAGSLRISALLGPLLGGVLAVRHGYTVTFLAAMAMVALGLACLLLFAGHDPPQAAAFDWRRLPAVARHHARSFATAGSAAVVFMLMRAARTVLLPLYGAALGLDVATIGLVVGVSAAIDVALFYPAGMAMDRYGRRATAVPAACLFTFALASLALVESYTGLLLAGIGIGIADGLSTGIVMTLGADLAPRDARGEFLGLWRLLTDFGNAAGPMVVSAVVAAASLAAAALTVAGLGALGSFVLWRHVPETLVRPAVVP